MDRVKVILPNTFSFFTSIKIRINDINYGGHLGNDSFFSIMHEARLQYLKQFGYTETNIENVGLIMADAAIEFKAEAFYGDELNIGIKAENFSKYGFDLYYIIEKNADSKVLVAKAKTAMLCMNYSTRKLASLPQIVKDKLAV
jgi:acyl-CoA thioester hydrolase